MKKFQADATTINFIIVHIFSSVVGVSASKSLLRQASPSLSALYIILLSPHLPMHPHPLGHHIGLFPSLFKATLDNLHYHLHFTIVFSPLFHSPH